MLQIKNALLAAAVVLTGCSATPFIEVGAGYAGDGGTYWEHAYSEDKIDEKCAIAHASAGVAWANGWEIEASHRSCVNQKPEVVTNHILLTRRVYLGARR